MTHARRFAPVSALVVAVLVAASCSSADRAEPVTTTTAATAATAVGPNSFARRVDDPQVVTINVHVPDEGSLAGTDLTIPFDQIKTSGALPSDRDTPLAVYCRSGNMSADAVRDLEAMGYTDIVELDGGFNAWTEAGRPLNAPGR